MAFTIAYGSVSVDFTNLNPSLTHRFTNPLVAVATPVVSGAALGDNVIVINLGFSKNQITVNFMAYDGYGSFNFTTPGSTVYEKLVYMANGTKNAKTITLGSTTLKGHIDGLDVTFSGGKKNLCTGSFTITLAKDVKMEG